MKSFVRMTKLHDIVGRVDYISNPNRQEYIVITSPSVDWKPYQVFERNNQKTSKKNNEGRELKIALPNEWDKLDCDVLFKNVQLLAEISTGKSTNIQWAVHWNKSKTNLHAHIIFSERSLCDDAGVWDRDIYKTSDGKIARRKSDRVKDSHGNFLPPVHRKGELKDGFTTKDSKYTSQAWYYNTKISLSQTLENLGANIEPYDPLKQRHEGKGKHSGAIREENNLIKESNTIIYAWIDEYVRIMGVEPSQDDLREVKLKMLRAVKDGHVGSLDVLLPDVKSTVAHAAPHQEANEQTLSKLPLKEPYVTPTKNIVLFTPAIQKTLTDAKTSKNSPIPDSGIPKTTISKQHSSQNASNNAPKTNVVNRMDISSNQSAKIAINANTGQKTAIKRNDVISEKNRQKIHSLKKENQTLRSYDENIRKYRNLLKKVKLEGGMLNIGKAKIYEIKIKSVINKLRDENIKLPEPINTKSFSAWDYDHHGIDHNDSDEYKNPNSTLGLSWRVKTQIDKKITDNNESIERFKPKKKPNRVLASNKNVRKENELHNRETKHNDEPVIVKVQEVETFHQQERPPSPLPEKKKKRSIER